MQEEDQQGQHVPLEDDLEVGQQQHQQHQQENHLASPVYDMDVELLSDNFDESCIRDENGRILLPSRNDPPLELIDEPSLDEYCPLEPTQQPTSMSPSISPTISPSMSPTSSMAHTPSSQYLSSPIPVDNPVLMPALVESTPEIVTANNKNAIETPFLAVLSPQKGMGGIPIGF